MMSNHTPGPWVIESLDDDPNFVNIECDGGGSEGITITGNDAVMNACLVGHAPELLEACRAADRILAEIGFVPKTMTAMNHVAVVKQIRDAIAKAEGLDNPENPVRLLS
jgi:hypothetical protein